MKKTLIILGSLFLLGCILKICRLPYDAVLMVFSSLIVSVIYFIFSFYIFNKKSIKDIFKANTYSGIGVYRSIISVITGFALSSFIVGVLFLTKGYPGANTMLLSGGIWSVICVIALLLGKKHHKEFAITGLKHILAVFCVAVASIAICLIGSQSQKTENNANNLTKEQAITTFKTEMKALRDSANFYYDIALFELEKGTDKEVISEMISPKLQSFEEQISTKTRAFQEIATNAGLNKEEYETVFSDLQQFFQPIMDKFKILHTNGIEIKKQTK